MTEALTLEYWRDDGWYVGHLKEVPGIFSQGETLGDLEDNIRGAYDLALAGSVAEPGDSESILDLPS